MTIVLCVVRGTGVAWFGATTPTDGVKLVVTRMSNATSHGLVRMLRSSKSGPIPGAASGEDERIPTSFASIRPWLIHENDPSVHVIQTRYEN